MIVAVQKEVQAPMSPTPHTAGQVLLQLARRSIDSALRGEPLRPAVAPDWLLAPGACRVSLNLDGRERGAALSHGPTRPLGEDVGRNAVAAALRDPCHPPLGHGEFAAVRLEVTQFTRWQPLQAGDEASVLAQLRPGEDAVFFRYGRHCSMFLPGQWLAHPDPAEFIAHLKYRAGLPPDFWAAQVELASSGAMVWQE